MEKKDLEAMAYTDPPQYALTPPHELEILNLNEELNSSNRLSYIQPINSPPLRLLSLDGGGVKGYSSLLLLQEVMYRLFIEIHSRPPQMHEIPLPCDHFDMIAGVGTGGLIALMLGRLRMDIETCKEQWVKMTKRVFETDKTIAGIPYRNTFFKASRLESVIKEIVRDHTIGEEEEAKRQQQQKKRESSLYPKDVKTRPRAESSGSSKTIYSRRSHELRALAGDDHPRLQPQKSLMFEYINKIKTYQDGTPFHRNFGDPNTLLYDPREDRCKTFVAAMYQNSPDGTPPCLLRTYLSLTTLNPEPQCRIWEAGRATSATMTAFKPIQIGQTCFLDEGAGKYNICPTVLEEATCNEWPGRAVGCVVSIGTGQSPRKKRNNQQWWENKLHTPFDHFTEAKKRLVFKTQLSEDIHQTLVGGGPESLDKWGVQKDDYFRLNVDMSTGDYAMNEWQRLSDISTSTRRWLCSPEGKKTIGDCALKLAHIWRAKNIPPPKNPLRQIPPMAELPVEPSVLRTPQRHNTVHDITPRASKPRPRSQVTSQQPLFNSPTQASNPPVSIARSRSIQVPVRTVSQCYQAHRKSQSQSTSSTTYRDSFYTSEDEGDDMRPRPLSVRQKSFTASSPSNSSSSIVIDGGLISVAGGNGREKRYTTAASVPPIPSKRVMTEGIRIISNSEVPVI
ncbi:hypothetical protein TWF694_001280 [Orbilia ellipsospora]|uniref:PNPLA domain-containing protein n=1 Tax=Orbilia ellipsospora TaxID=2528407 RepID=A0AAV9XR61_9PEZI